MDGIERVLVTPEANCEVFFENMDAKRFPLSDQQEQHLAKLFQDKYAGIHLDAVLVSDNHALNFILKYRHVLAPNVPIIFCGINGFREEMLQGQSGITGVVEKLDHISNLRLMAQMNPNARTIIAIADCSLTGRLMMEEFSTAMKIAGMRYRLEKWLCISPEEIKQKLRGYSPQDTILFPLSYYSMPDGSVLTFEEYCTVFRDISFQTFTGYDIYVDNGLMGGAVIDGYLHGETAAKMVLQVLGGTDANTIPVMYESPISIKFQYDQLNRTGANQDAIPDDAIILGKPISFYTTYRLEIWLTIIAGGVLTVLMIIFLGAIIRTNRHNRSLAEQKERFDLAMNAVADGLWDWDLITNEVYFSDHYYTMLGYTPGEFPATYQEWEHRLHPKDKERVVTYLTGYLNHAAAYGAGENYSVEFRMLMKNGSYKWVLGRGGLSEAARDGRPLRMVGTHMDLSESARLCKLIKE